MPSPSTQITNLRPDLGSMYEFDLELNRQKFIGYRVLPIRNVALAADSFGKIPIEQLLKRANVRRGVSGNYNRIDWKFTTDSYATEEFGLEGTIDQRNARKYANYIDAEAATARLVLHQVLLEAELRVAAMTFDTGTFTPTAVSVEWSTYATAKPIDDVEASVRRVHAATGIWPDSLVICEKVFRNLRLCDQVLDRIAATGAGDKIKATDVTTQMLAQVFDLKNIVVAGGTYNSANEAATAALTDIWDDEYAMVCKLADSDMIEEPCLGRTFHWAGDGSQPGGLVETYYEESSRGDVVRVRHDVHEKLVYDELGDLLSNITA